MTATPLETARDLIKRHGIRAKAVAEEHAAEQRHAGNPDAIQHWQAVASAVERLASRP